MNKETRILSQPIEARTDEDGKRRIFGYAALFDSIYKMYGFTEELSRGAFDGADMSDVRVLFNHDPNFILGRTKSGTAKVYVDERGLYYEVDLPDGPDGDRIFSAITRGDVDQSSWGFMLSKNGDNWEGSHRTITRVSTVFDVSPVTFPANPDTSAARRSMEQAAQERMQRAKNLNLYFEIDLAIKDREDKTNT